jgi:hypothetical protein
MLSVGRQLNLREKVITCRECLWDGERSQLAAGLVQINHSRLQVYAYRCPACGSFDLVIKGKLIPFTLKKLSGNEEPQNSTETPDLLIDNGNTEKSHSR